MKDIKEIDLNELKYWTYLSGKIAICEILKIHYIQNLCNIKTQDGNLKKISLDKIFENKIDIIRYLKNNKFAYRIVNNYEIDICKGLEVEII